MMSTRLWYCLALSTLLHALLLKLPGFAPALFGGSDGSGGGRVTVSLRVLDNAVPAADAALSPEPAANPPPEVEASAASPQDEAPDHTPNDAPSEAGNREAAAESPSSGAPLPVLPSSLPRGIDRDAYLASDALDVRPAPEQPIVIGFDDPSRIDKDRGQVVLVLYVGADGRIDLVDIDRSDVPPDVAEIVAETFRVARMRPGRKDGRPVPARMKILVEFEVR